MNTNKKIIMICLLGSLVLFLSVFVACTNSLVTYKGKTADKKSRIALPDGPHKGVWSTDDLTAQYSYSRKANDLRIFGQVELSKKLKDASDIVQDFFLQVTFLDADGQALDTKVLAAAGHREPFTKLHFDRNYELPASTSAMAFSYDGQMGEDATGGSDEEFWHDPFR